MALGDLADAKGGFEAEEPILRCLVDFFGRPGT